MSNATAAAAGHLRMLQEALTELSASLDEESQLLLSGKADALPAITRRKDPLLRQIGSTWSSLAHLLGQPDNASSASLAIAIAALRDAELAELWARAEASAREVSRRNQANGLLIQEQLRHAHAALQVLHEAANRSGLYGADGQSLGVFSGRRKIDEV